MANFNYIARSRAGEKVDGTIEATDRRAALLQIERMGCVPISVSEGGALLGEAAKEKTKGKKKGKVTVRHGFHRKPRMKLGELLVFTRELSDLLASGMTLGNALNALSRRKTEKAQDVIVVALRDEIVKGASLSEALSKWPETFAGLYVSMVRAGEASGQLAGVLERLARHYELVREAKEKVIMALVYPAIVLFMGGATLIFIMIWVVPKFMAIFEELGSTMPLPTLIMIGASKALIKYGWVILGVFIALIIILRRAIRTKTGRRWWHRAQLRMPLVKRIVSANAFAHFARTLGELLANGVPVLDALAIVEDTVGNVVIAEEIHGARGRVTDGSTISGPLAAGKVFPPLLTEMLAVGEQSGDMSGALLHIAKRYENELDRSVKLFTTVLEPVLIVGIAAIVAYVAVSMLMAVFDMTSGLSV